MPNEYKFSEHIKFPTPIEAEKPSSDDDFEARGILQDILEEEELERHIEEMLMDAIDEGANNA